MADLKITQLTEVTSPIGTDVLPIVNASETKKVSITNLNNSLPITTFVQGASGSWGATGYPMSRMTVTAGSNTNNSVEFIVPYNNIEFQTDTSVIEVETVNRNLILKQNGTYIVECRYASYDLFYAGAASQGTLRVRLRSSASPITSTGGGTLLHQVGAGAVTTGTWNADPGLIVDNGLAERSGTFIVRVTSAPLYLAVTALHTGGTANGNTQAFPVVINNDGVQPYIQAKLIPS